MAVSRSTLRCSLYAVSFFYVFHVFNLYDLTDWVKDGMRGLGSRSSKDRLVVFNAIGKRNNIALIEHARTVHFRPDEWDCIAFMFLNEEQIPDDDVHLRKLIDELGCSIPRTPGFNWSTFLLTVTPTFVSNYDYVALVLEDVFLPSTGPNPVDIDKLLIQMNENDISVISPAVMGDTHNAIDVASNLGLNSCIAEVNMIESYLQIFTRDAWECYYKMLHYSGIRGWCYNMCFKNQCPDLNLAQDFSMIAWHTGNDMTEIPLELRNGHPSLDTWKNEPSLRTFTTLEDLHMCAKLDCGAPASTQELLDQSRPIESMSLSMNAIDCASEEKINESTPIEILSIVSGEPEEAPPTNSEAAEEPPVAEAVPEAVEEPPVAEAEATAAAVEVV